MTSNTLNCCANLSFIKKLKKIVILHKCLVFICVKASLGFMPIWGYVQMYSGRHVVVIDFQPLGLKSDRKERVGRFSGLKFKI